MKKYENVKIEIVPLSIKEDILSSSGTSFFIDENGAIDGEMDYAN